MMLGMNIMNGAVKDGDTAFNGCGHSEFVPSLAVSLCIFALCFAFARIIAKSCRNR
jgi:hypothetical protein